MSRAYRGSITKLGEKHWRVRVTVGYDADGKQVRASETVRGSRAEAEAALERLRRQQGADSVTYGRMSVYEFVRDEWLPSRALRATTLKGYNATMENHIKPAFANVRMKDVTPLHITKVLRGISNKGAALNVYKMLRSAMGLAAQSRILAYNPVDAVERPKVDEYEADVYTLDEMLAAIGWAEGEDIQAGVVIAATCGTRASETCALDWRDVHLDRGGMSGYIDVSKGYHRVQGKRLVTPTKTKRSSRQVALPAFAVEMLLDLRGVGPLMVDRTGERMTPEGFSQRWRRLMKPSDTNKPPVRFIPLKNLRHSRATVMLDLGATMHDVSISMGHVNERTTDTFYNKPDRTPDQGLADMMDAAVKRKAAGA